MKKYCIGILSIFLILMLSACEPVVAAQASAASSADFSGTDFKGVWYVSEVLTPGGKPVDSGVMQQMGSGFSLELIDNGIYFLYGSDGSVLGQGQYSITGSILTLTAGSGETVYQIMDANTLQSVSKDKSVTVMTKQPAPSPAASEEDINDSSDDNEPDADVSGDDSDQDAPEDSIAPESSPDSTPGPSASPAVGTSN